MVKRCIRTPSPKYRGNGTALILLRVHRGREPIATGCGNYPLVQFAVEIVFHLAFQKVTHQHGLLEFDRQGYEASNRLALALVQRLLFERLEWQHRDTEKARAELVRRL